MSISAKDVMKLRQITGAGMMDCKKALAESAGDLDAAVDYLRKKGLKTAEKRADREANEGKVVAHLAADGRGGCLLEFNCETDFVAGTPEFKQFALDAAALAFARQPADVASLLGLESPGGLLSDRLSEMTAKLGEKMGVRRYATLAIPEGRQGLVHSYIHLGDKHGVLIALTCDKAETAQAPAFRELVNDLALQVVAYAPQAVDRDGIDAASVERELDVYRELARNEGKPEAIIDKIAQGKLGKFYAEATLLEQAFLKEEKDSVQQVVNRLAKGLDDRIVVEAFESFVIGQ
jgi:elongation factor Ts